MNPFDAGWARRSKPQGAPASEAAPKAAHADCAGDARFTPCHILAPDLVAYFDDEADAPSAQRARRHLDACPECARMWRDWGDTRLLMRTQRLPSTPSHWPASIVQRARLQALLPSLFAPADAAELLLEESDFCGIEAEDSAPRQLRDAILARTTRASSGLPQSTASANPAASQQQRRRRAMVPNRYKIVTRACVPALAAWMIVLASAPLAPPPAERADTTSTSLQEPQKASRATVAPGAALGQSEEAAYLSTAEPLELLGAMLRESEPANRPTPDVIVEKAPAKREEPQTAPLLPKVKASAARSEDRPEPRDLDAERQATRSDAASIAHREAPAPLAQATEVAASTSVSAGRAVAKATLESTSVAPMKNARPAEAAMAVAKSEAPTKSVEHEPLGVVRELNDTRPAEIGDAIDAYASTWMDDSDAPQ
jgi:hypothetical protein